LSAGGSRQAVWRANNWSTVPKAKRRAHSHKPEEFYRMVEKGRAVQ
jgi:N6-adenosine-specific RNA methylase IME4